MPATTSGFTHLSDGSMPENQRPKQVVELVVPYRFCDDIELNDVSGDNKYTQPTGLRKATLSDLYRNVVDNDLHFDGGLLFLRNSQTKR